jgi:hypothetical protein
VTQNELDYEALRDKLQAFDWSLVDHVDLLHAKKIINRYQ